MKALVKLAPIIVMLACAASLFFAFKVSGIKADLKTKNAELDSDLKTKKGELQAANKKFEQGQTQLKAATAESESLTKQLATKKDELAKMTTDADELRTQVANLQTKVTTAEQSLDKIKQSLAAAGLGGADAIDEIAKKVQSMTSENKLLGEQLASSKDEATRLQQEIKDLKTTPPGLRGSIALAKPDWNFVVLDIGQTDRVRPGATFLVYRDSKLIAKAHVTTVRPGLSVAELDPGFTTSPPHEGDRVVHEKM